MYKFNFKVILNKNKKELIKGLMYDKMYLIKVVHVFHF